MARVYSQSWRTGQLWFGMQAAFIAYYNSQIRMNGSKLMPLEGGRLSHFAIHEKKHSNSLTNVYFLLRYPL